MAIFECRGLANPAIFALSNTWLCHATQVYSRFFRNSNPLVQTDVQIGLALSNTSNWSGAKQFVMPTYGGYTWIFAGRLCAGRKLFLLCIWWTSGRTRWPSAAMVLISMLGRVPSGLMVWNFRSLNNLVSGNIMAITTTRRTADWERTL